MRDECVQLQLRLPLSAGVIRRAVDAFKRQFGADRCYLYVRGHVAIETGQLCQIPGWASVVGPDEERDVLIVGDVEGAEANRNWVRLMLARLLLSTHSLVEGGPLRKIRHCLSGGALLSFPKIKKHVGYEEENIFFY
ncbi:hypothetical protein [Ktedonobacter racemifer]|uniref:Uncharacterized protein n=1 Tax=Ktedonobacter racemifer DSM 44963 TaxID=485913 RepID=D6U158_KTERA|nr:hypothetical protein [Ktedonobacter racemifer]EFH82548.1 hypothetical protein Krac_3366 [Ktedonobacter racemifer DSM 44963]